MRKYMMNAVFAITYGTRADVIICDDLPIVELPKQKPMKRVCKKPDFLLERDCKSVHKRK